MLPAISSNSDYSHHQARAFYHPATIDGIHIARSRNQCGAAISGNTGFTLIEIAIVLVIIGLLVGVVMVGQSLIKSSQIRSVVSEITSIRTAVNTFKLKYNALPGDFASGDIWHPEKCSLAWSHFCNGDGNGKIEWSQEGYLAWNHLGAAGMIKGNYKGETLNSQSNIGLDVPGSAITQDAFYFMSYAPVYKRIGNYVGLSRNNGQYPEGSILDTADAFAIDEKSDDGYADKGQTYGLNGDYYSETCTDATRIDIDPPPAAANYIRDNKLIACRMLFWLN